MRSAPEQCSCALMGFVRTSTYTQKIIFHLNGKKFHFIIGSTRLLTKKFILPLSLGSKKKCGDINEVNG
jgi:hypothetical protein